MHLRVVVTRVDPAHWRIEYPGLGAAGAPRTVERAAAGVYPLIKPPSAVNWKGDDVADIGLRIASKQQRVGDVEAFGRHLFAVLLGDPIWNEAIQRGAGGVVAAIELCSTDLEFTRLPWEMMCGPGGFLAKDGVGLVRMAPAPGAAELKVTVRPRVLFVIGSELHDARIRAGAEYLGLLRRLKASGLPLESHILPRATSKRLEDALLRINPSIVHFICHGGTEASGAGYLQLVSEDKNRPFDKITASQLTALTAGIAPVVVLNACYSGAGGSDTASLALEVLLGGVPVVIGMSGRVADRACRLFTCRLYEALLSGQPIDRATAEARRDGMVHGADPYATVDWAMPALFLRDLTRLEVDAAEIGVLKQRSQRARQYRQITDPAVLCGRTDCLHAFQSLLEGADADRPRVLVLKVVERHASVTNPQYGKTRLLEEMAADAALRGHVPCLVTFPKDQAPKSPWSLAWKIIAAALDSRPRFGLNENPVYELSKLSELLHDSVPNPPVAPPVQQQLNFHPLAGLTDPSQIHAAVAGAALKVDFEALASEARAAKGASPELKLVILIDDVHLCGAAGKDMVENWASGSGLLGRSNDPIPLVISYSAVAEKEVYEADVEAIKLFIEQRPSVFLNADLKAFPSPLEDELPYQQLFLARKLVVGDVQPDQRTGFFTLFHEYVRGVPSRFDSRPDNDAVGSLIKAGKLMKVLEEADDDKILKQLSGGN